MRMSPGLGGFGIGQLELISLSMVSPELKASLVAELNAVKAEGRHSAVLVLTDIMKEGSELLLSSDDENTIINALGAQKADVMWMPGVMSRKKQVFRLMRRAAKCGRAIRTVRRPSSRVPLGAAWMYSAQHPS